MKNSAPGLLYIRLLNRLTSPLCWEKSEQSSARTWKCDRSRGVRCQSDFRPRGYPVQARVTVLKAPTVFCDYEYELRDCGSVSEYAAMNRAICECTCMRLVVLDDDATRRDERQWARIAARTHIYAAHTCAHHNPFQFRDIICHSRLSFVSRKNAKDANYRAVEPLKIYLHILILFLHNSEKTFVYPLVHIRKR